MLLGVLDVADSLLIVSSVASNVLARASVLSGAETDPETSPNDLLEP